MESTSWSNTYRRSFPSSYLGKHLHWFSSSPVQWFSNNFFKKLNIRLVTTTSNQLRFSQRPFFFFNTKKRSTIIIAEWSKHRFSHRNFVGLKFDSFDSPFVTSIRKIKLLPLCSNLSFKLIRCRPQATTKRPGVDKLRCATKPPVIPTLTDSRTPTNLKLNAALPPRAESFTLPQPTTSQPLTLNLQVWFTALHLNNPRGKRLPS